MTTAVFAPAAATIAGALRGVMPFAVPRKSDPEALLPIVRNAMWLALTVGGVCAVAVASVPPIGGAAGVPVAVLDQLGFFPWLLAGSVLLMAVASRRLPSWWPSATATGSCGPDCCAPPHP